jgi:biopolymer transport protein ExbD
MKLTSSKRVHYDSGPNLTPLVDVVMVLLIFLMLAGSFRGTEHYLVSNLPIVAKGAGSALPPAGFVPDEPLDIRVDSPVSDRFVARAGQIQTGDAKALTLQLTKMREQFLSTGTPTDRIQVVIAPGKNVRYQYLVEVYESALRAGFTKVGFAQSH